MSGKRGGFQDGQKPHYWGHRQRLRERFLKAGPDALPDYEFLELLLFRVFRRGDTKPLAKALLERFGSFSGVLNAPEHLLREVKGVGDAVIFELKLTRAAALRMKQGELKKTPIIRSWSALLDYLNAAMAHETREQFRIIFLDKKNRIIADEVQQEGTIDHTPVYVREVCKRALELSASAIVLVHNHPSGDPTPSGADIEMTRQIVETAKGLGITVHDHIIIGREGHASLQGLGLM